MSNQLFLGKARRDINPSMPISLAGYFNERIWDKVLDNLEVRAVAFKQDNNYFLLVQFDLITVNTIFYNKLRAKIKDIEYLKDNNIIFTATHTHTAPDTSPENQAVAAPYLDFAAEKASEAIREALANLKECELYTTTACDERFAFNRRYWMQDGTVVTNPGKLNANIVKPEGPVDYEIPVAAFKCGGKIELVIANIVNHTDTTGGNGVSADWVNFTRKALENELGATSMVMPLIGCAGNINHFDVSTDMNQTNEKEPERIGLGYAETLSLALKNLVKEAPATIKTSFRAVTIPAHAISKAELDEAKEILEKYSDIEDPQNSGITLTSEDLANKTPMALKYFAKTMVEFAEIKYDYTFNLVGLSIGNWLLASLPGEPFVEIGLDIRKRFFGDKLCMVASHCNGTGNEKNGGGYIPNLWNYGRGGYETTIRSNPYSKTTASEIRQAWCDVEQSKEL